MEERIPMKKSLRLAALPLALLLGLAGCASLPEPAASLDTAAAAPEAAAMPMAAPAPAPAPAPVRAPVAAAPEPAPVTTAAAPVSPPAPVAMAATAPAPETSAARTSPVAPVTSTASAALGPATAPPAAIAAATAVPIAAGAAAPKASATTLPASTLPAPAPARAQAQAQAAPADGAEPVVTPVVIASVSPALPQPVVFSGPLSPIASTEAASASVATLEVPPDLWDRIRRGFSMPNLEGELVRQHEQWYSSRPDYIQRMTERSRKYLFHIVEELELRGMPLELALLPYIESAFNPQAVSSARAAGMWQFMPATGTDFELRQNMFRDDRRDVLASTRAALDYLQKLHGMFGDWHLALAAYNWGQGNVGRSIQRNQRAGLPTTYAALGMPAETRHYVPKLQAVKNIVLSPEVYRAELPLIENHPYFDTVEIARDIDVELAAKLADVRLEDFRALNPSMNRPVILAAGTPQILLPWDNAKVFKTNLAAYTAGQYASWTAWTAPTHMTVAEAARRVGIAEADFRSLNNIPPRMMIRAGSVVLAPRSAKQADVPSQLAHNAQLNLAPEITLRRTSVKAGQNESVATIARRYRVRAADVASWNNVAAQARFKPGQAIVLHLPVQATRKAAPKASQPTRAAAKPAAPRTAAPARTQPDPKVTAKQTPKVAATR
jgi:membrane-bound lytic murein transglycosylase D